jgi:hypothetical protein
LPPVGFRFDVTRGRCSPAEAIPVHLIGARTELPR